MAKATEGRVYAQIMNGKAHWIFTHSDLPEWAEGTGEFAIQTIDITDMEPMPQVGWPYTDGDFQQPQPAAAVVPQEVTRFQARAALLQAGLLDDVESLLFAAGADRMLQLAYEAATFKRHSQFVQAMAQQLGLTEQQLDDLFITASQIE